MTRLNLNTREGKVLVGGTVLVVVLLSLFFVPDWLREYNASKTRLKTARANLEYAGEYCATVVSARRNEEELMRYLRKRRGFELWSFLNRTVRDTELHERGAEVKTFQQGVRSAKLSAVQVALKGVSLTELVDLLHKVYDGENLVVLHSAQHIKQSLDGKGLDCNLIFLTPNV